MSRLQLSASLALALVSGFAQADIVIPPLTEGTYRGNERQAFMPAELGLSLSIAPLPDPAADLPRNDPGLESDRRHLLWTDDTAWITGIGAALYHDSDRDGYYSAFSLTIDADTTMNILDVYVSIDLQSYSGARERLYTSGSFSLYGRALTDEYQIEIDLLQNYPNDDYNLFIELHDTYDHRVLDRVGATDFSNLAALPLESEDLDNYYDPRPFRPLYPPANDDIRVAEYVGSSGLLMTLGLSLSLWIRRRAST